MVEQRHIKEYDTVLRMLTGDFNPNHDPNNGQFTNGEEIPVVLDLPDETVGRSLGAKANVGKVMDLATGQEYEIAEGSVMQDKQVFAGKGTRHMFRKASDFASRYGGDPKDWAHVKAVMTLNTPDGYRKAEVHWSECEGIGKQELFIKKWIEE